MEGYTSLIEKGISGRLFSGYAALVGDLSGVSFESYGGTLAFDDASLVEANSFFDLASLTKTLVAALFYRLFFVGEISPEDELPLFLEGFPGIPVSHLLRHRSGYPAYRAFYRMFRGVRRGSEKEVLLSYLRLLRPVYAPVYSDINYIILGFVLEGVFGVSLKKIFEREFGKEGVSYGVAPGSAVATSFSAVRGRLLRGEVEDENAFFLGGVAGHAGVFATARGWFNIWRGILESEEFNFAETLGFPGFDRPDSEFSSYGSGTKTIGHMGFTGTAFVISPSEKKVALLFTNRTHPYKKKANAKAEMRALRHAFFSFHKF